MAILLNLVKIELGRVKNVNKNPVAEKAVRELECEIVHQQPTGGTATQLVLSVATANLNTRVRNKGFSARELWTQRDQFTNEQLPLTQRPANPGPRAKVGPRTSFNWPASACFQHKFFC